MFKWYEEFKKRRAARRALKLKTNFYRVIWRIERGYSYAPNYTYTVSYNSYKQKFKCTYYSRTWETDTISLNTLREKLDSETLASLDEAMYNNQCIGWS